MNNFEENQGSNFEKLEPDIRMQADLALRFYGLKKELITEESFDPYFIKWIEYEGGRFPENFRYALVARPELLDLYQKDSALALEKMEAIIYAGMPEHIKYAA